jgi:hypothetical protein
MLEQLGHFGSEISKKNVPRHFEHDLYSHVGQVTTFFGDKFL